MSGGTSPDPRPANIGHYRPEPIKRYLVFPGPGSGLPSKKVGDRVSDDPVVDVDVGLLPLELFPLELLDPHPPARAATTTRAAAPSEAEQRTVARFELVITVLPSKSAIHPCR